MGVATFRYRRMFTYRVAEDVPSKKMGVATLTLVVGLALVSRNDFLTRTIITVATPDRRIS